MTHIEQAIKEAVEKGKYRGQGFDAKNYTITPHGIVHNGFITLEHLFLDPLFWQALGKAREWSDEAEIKTFGNWKWYWHRFIDHLAEGKDAESFFTALS